MIPHKLHFIFGLTPDFGGKPFSFCHWAAIRSAQIKNEGWDTTVWTAFEPSGRYWEAIKPHVEVREIETPAAVFGNSIPHPAHKCDWLRLQVLKEHGGVYLDCDTITVKPFGPLLTEPATMVTEFAYNELVGLCNAFIASEPESEFIIKWINKFKGFRSIGRDQHWNESAVKWPHELWHNGADVTAMMSESFMQPDWTPDGIDAMFEHEEQFPFAYGHHLWESFSWGYLSGYTPENYDGFPCTYARLLKEVLGETIQSELLNHA